MEKPICVSTWEFGLKAVQKAAELFSKEVHPLDVVEQSIWVVEDDPNVASVGFGGLPNQEGVVELDAVIFDGPRKKIGAVAALTGIRHAISVARLVMEKSPHIVMAGSGGKEFAIVNGMTEENLLSDAAKKRFEEWKANPVSPFDVEPFSHDTICLLVRDKHGNLYAGGSTSGLAWKLPGRVGDVPLIGCGMFVDNEIGAAAATGTGELAIRECASMAVLELMRNQYDPEEACQIVLQRALKGEPRDPRQLALIALRKDGKIGFASLKPGFQAAVLLNEQASLVEVNSLS
jgi:isoaspartyl peptidase/L-asparaginase-like protein (Ntn-hydrolase superfamily)